MAKFNLKKIRADAQQRINITLAERAARKAEEKAIYQEAYNEAREGVLKQKAQIRVGKLIQRARNDAEGFSPKFSRAINRASDYNKRYIAPKIRAQFKKAVSGGPKPKVRAESQNDFFGLGGSSNRSSDMFDIGNMGMNIGLTPERKRKSRRRSGGFGIGIKPVRFF